MTIHDFDLDEDIIDKEWRCPECNGILTDSEMLIAPNPFNEVDTITGCPYCLSVVEFFEICDESGCVANATCGFPTPEGYRRTCGDHMRAARK